MRGVLSDVSYDNMHVEIIWGRRAYLHGSIRWPLLNVPITLKLQHQGHTPGFLAFLWSQPEN